MIASAERKNIGVAEAWEKLATAAIGMKRRSQGKTLFI
jgi:hypothetical protein